jgi:ArsR family transcriptional regulator
MAQWFAAAGFSADAPIALHGGQLTVKIWTGRRLGAHKKVFADERQL